MSGVNSIDNQYSVDKSIFNDRIEIIALKVPAKETSLVIRKLNGELLHMPKRRNVAAPELQDEKSVYRLVLLNSKFRFLENEISPAMSDDSAEFLKLKQYPIVKYSVSIDYDDFSAHDVLKRLLKGKVEDGQEIIHSFETVGHIAHLNLKSYLLPFKHVIAQVILDKNNRVKTVLNKVGDVGSEFRTFPMEILAGESSTEVSQNENDCTFKFDFREVYWNSRLQSEHTRLIRHILNLRSEGNAASENELSTVFDMMAGVGPFSLPLAKQGIKVLANDLNPKSFDALQKNAVLNKVSDNVEATCMCGRKRFKKLLNEQKVFGHVIMNLPASAVKFLDVFVGIDWLKKGFSKPPLVHCYCFGSGDDPRKNAVEKVIAKLNGKIALEEVSVHSVREVAPKKPMLCVTFRLPDFTSEIEEGPLAKKVKI